MYLLLPPFPTPRVFLKLRNVSRFEHVWGWLLLLAVLHDFLRTRSNHPVRNFVCLQGSLPPCLFREHVR